MTGGKELFNLSWMDGSLTITENKQTRSEMLKQAKVLP
jgi:hypothetical protein